MKWRNVPRPAFYFYTYSATSLASFFSLSSTKERLQCPLPTMAVTTGIDHPNSSRFLLSAERTCKYGMTHFYAILLVLWHYNVEKPQKMLVTRRRWLQVSLHPVQKLWLVLGGLYLACKLLLGFFLFWDKDFFTLTKSSSFYARLFYN